MKKVKETRKYLIIAEHIRNDILKGRYKEGENIPSVRKLALKYNSTSLTVSKATAYLASLGYLIIRQGSGGKAVIPGKNSTRLSIVLLVNKAEKDLELPINYFYKDVYLSYLMCLNSKNYNAHIVSYSRDDKAVPETFYEEISGNDGVIVLGALPECYFKFFDKTGMPVVLMDREIPLGCTCRIGAVHPEMSKLEDAVRYLISLGHTGFIFSTDNDIIPDNVFYKRYDIIKNAIMNAGPKGSFELEVFKFSHESKKSGKELKMLMKKGFSAVISYNDISALNLYSLVSGIGMNIPGDLSIIGIDDIMPSKIAMPPLTTIRIDRDEMTLAAIGMVEDFISGGVRTGIVKYVDTELVIRKSVFRKKNPIK